MKLIYSLMSLAAALSAAIPLHAQIIDTFSTNDPDNYTTYLVYDGNNRGAAGFAINSSDQFEPTAAEDSTTAFFRNTGETLGIGDSVSIDVDNVVNGTVAGLAFATSLTGANATDAVVSLASSSPTFTVGGTALASITTDFSLGSVTENITRTGDTTFAFSLSGAGLTSGNVSGIFSETTFAGSNVYFGMEVYGGFPGTGGTNAPTEDNLAFTPASVPEPSTWVMMLSSAALLALFGVVRSQRFARE